MARGSLTGFQPVNLIPTPHDDADKLALKMVYSLMDDLVETMNTERSQQQEIGISEIGMECRRCVARKLSMEYTKIPDPSWKAQVGTFMHAGFEEHFRRKYAGRDGLAYDADGIPIMELDDNDYETDQQQFLPAAKVRERATDENPIYVPERGLSLWDYKGTHLGGHCDLFIQGKSFGIVDDWKTQGLEKLKTKTAKGNIGNAYLVQMMSYGLAYEMLGYYVTHVLLYAVPRDGELKDSKPVLMRYDRQIALDALAKLQLMIDAAEIVGWQRVIAAQPRAGYCLECSRYESQENDALVRSMTGN